MMFYSSGWLECQISVNCCELDWDEPVEGWKVGPWH